MKKIFSILLCFFVCFVVYAETYPTTEQIDRATIEKELDLARKNLAFEKEQYELTKTGSIWALAHDLTHVLKLSGDACSIAANIITIWKAPAVEAALKGKEGIQMTMRITSIVDSLNSLRQLMIAETAGLDKAIAINSILSTLKSEIETLNKEADFIKNNAKQLGVAGKTLDSLSLVGNLVSTYYDFINAVENWTTPAELERQIKLAKQEYEEAALRVQQLETMLKGIEHLESQGETPTLSGGVSMDVQVLEDGTVIAPDEDGGYTTCYPDGRVTHTDKNGKTTTVDNNQTETDSQQTIPDPDTESYTGVFGDILNGGSTTTEEAGDIVIETSQSETSSIWQNLGTVIKEKIGNWTKNFFTLKTLENVANWGLRRLLSLNPVLATVFKELKIDNIRSLVGLCKDVFNMIKGLFGGKKFLDLLKSSTVLKSVLANAVMWGIKLLYENFIKPMLTKFINKIVDWFNKIMNKNGLGWLSKFIDLKDLLNKGLDKLYSKGTTWTKAKIDVWLEINETGNDKSPTNGGNSVLSGPKLITD